MLQLSTDVCLLQELHSAIASPCRKQREQEGEQSERERQTDRVRDSGKLEHISLTYMSQQFGFAATFPV